VGRVCGCNKDMAIPQQSNFASEEGFIVKTSVPHPK